MTLAAVGLGSNLGDRRGELRQAVDALAELGTVVAISPLYESAPIGGPEQGAFLNAVVLLETDLSPADLLGELHRFEAEAGRERRHKWGPRTLDLDLLVYGDQRVETPSLVVPHPRLEARRFVLEPLAAVWPGRRLPDGRSLDALLAEVGEQAVVMVDEFWAGAGPIADPVPPTFAARGGWWVVAQAVLLATVAATLLVGDPEVGPRLWLGLVIAGAGALEAWLGLSALGQGLTPYPEPPGGSSLVETGIYRLVRHPIYGGVVLGCLGLSIAAGSLPAVAASVLTGAFFWVKAGFEEQRLRRRFPGYAGYARRTRRRLLPWVV